MNHMFLKVMSPNQYQRRHSAMLWVMLITNWHLRHLLSKVWCEDGLDAQFIIFMWILTNYSKNLRLKQSILCFVQ